MSVKKTVYVAFFIAVGIVLQIMESFIPVMIIIPGFKIGFANMAGLLALLIWDEKTMSVVTLSRIFLAALLQGTLFSVSFWLSLTGGILSLLAMIVAYKSKKFSIFGISILGACFHNVGQVIAITFIYQQYFMQLFLPILMALSNVSGLCIAYLTQKVYIRLKGRLQYGTL